ncbi:cyanophycinase [Clostridium fallax]|uniref:Cyanophycinase n=1 Tax=Clostridium fallax TaxID=1533 RepID=A0A1M4WHZ6_9CLOT|nr:cyanophycinase [Clostridium fallax]SHE80844.1 cyanophycinase [Clostridium fallax]SQB05718.1 cyanophycinase [Clostridium fallax]
METKAEGNLIIIGGAEDKEKDKEILKFICSKFNKEKGLFLIATIATELPKEVGESYRKIFSELGVKNIKILDVLNRDEGSLEENIKMVKEASIIFFTGGDQLRITSILGGTPLGEEIINVCEKGCYFVGTSAGASVMSDTMIVNGPDDESPRKCTLKMAPGLGMIKNVIIDQHFSQRGRIGRLLAGIAQNPQVLGIGIDEDTAIVVNKQGFVQVIGNGAVYILDGTCINYTNVSEQYQENILSIHNVKLHVLTNGDKFDLLKKRPFKEERL